MADQSNLDLIGLTLTATAANGVLAGDADTGYETPMVSSVDGQAGNVGVAVAGTYGSLTLNANGSYTYAANSGASAGSVDSFSYVVSDGNGATATLQITLDNLPPGLAGVGGIASRRIQSKLHHL